MSLPDFKRYINLSRRQNILPTEYQNFMEKVKLKIVFFGLGITAFAGAALFLLSRI